MRFANQSVLVTGAAQGIGFAVARAFASEGAAVVIADVNEGCERARDKLLAEGFPQVIAVRGDVSVRADVDRMFEEESAAFGEVDILVNNAGITRDALFHKMTEEQWDQVMDVNLKSMFFTIQAALRQMLPRKKGVIVNVASITGQMGNLGQTNYAASKAGVQALTRNLCLEYACRGIRVNAVAPGFTFSEMTKAIPEQIVQQMIAKIPMKRGADPSEIAAAILFLASEEASFVNGQTLSVNGGMYL